MLQIVQKAANLPTGNITGPTAGVVSFYSPIAGAVSEIRVGGPASSTVTFNVTVSGVPLFAGAGRPVTSPSARIAVKTGTLATLLEQSWISLNIENIVGTPGPNAFNQTFLLMKVEDGNNLSFTIGTVTYMTSSIADGTTENANVPLMGKSFEIHKITVDKPCRVRVYRNEAFRTADASRPIGTLPANADGVVTDVVFPLGTLEYVLDPIPKSVNEETVRVGSAAVAIENMSGTTGTVTVTFGVVISEV